MNGLVYMNHHGMSNNPFLTKIEANSLINASHSSFGHNPLLVDVELNSLTSCNGDDFINDTSLEILNLPSLISASYNIANGCTSLKSFTSTVQSFTIGSNFSGCSSIELIDIKSCTSLGDPTVNDGNFSDIKTGCVINVNIALQTANAGGVEADLAWAIANRGAIVNYFP